MKLESSHNSTGPHRYRRRRRPLVGPTGSPYLDATLLLQTKSCRWFRSKKPVNPTKKVTFRDEAIISMSVAGEVTDASIMEIGRSRPQFQYTREELMEIKLLPLAKRRPECLDLAYNNSRGTWDPERWHMERKRSETPPEEDQRRNDVPIEQNKRRSGDPRERLRKEQDGIVLSPQRRSFNSGCFVNVTLQPLRRPESPTHKPEVPHREPVRRIGSGRLLTRDMWDFRPETEKLEPERTDYGFRNSGNGPRDVGREPMRDRDNIRDRDMRDDRNDRYERRSFGRDYGDRENRDRNDRHPMDRDKDRRERKFGTDRRRTYSSEPKEPEEPEWFSGGPISQHDTIELRGFDDIPEVKSIKSKKAAAALKKRGKKGNEKDEKSESTNSAGPKGRSTPTAMDQPINPIHAPHSPISEQEELSADEKKMHQSNDSVTTEQSDPNDQSEGKSRDGEHLDFNLDDFLKSDNLPGVSGLLTNGVGSDVGSGSRFSQWFKRESPVQDSRRESIQDELLNNLLNDITEPNIQVPSVNESNTYFAPISPANQTGGNAATGTKLLEMLQRGNKPSQNGQGDGSHMMGMMKNASMKDMGVGGKVIHSLEELETRMRGGVPPLSHIEPQLVNKTDDDMAAFKKLLAQVSGGQVVPAAKGPSAPKSNTQPVTLMQILKNSGMAIPQQPPMPEKHYLPAFNHVGPLGPAQHPHQAQMQHENLMKVLRIQQQQQQAQQQKRQQQTDMLSMMMGGQRMVGGSPVPPEMQMLVNNAPSSRELLQRPEAQAIIQGLQQGEITRQHLIQQIQNPAMQHRHREVLMNILKMYGNTTPRTVSPHQNPNIPHEAMLQQLLYQQQQQQQQQRVPSPMNNALCPPLISPNVAARPNTLSIQHPVIPHRVPSPRDLVMHTQSIMQSALIKTKLEEQRENYRKRQEQQQVQQMQTHHRIGSPVNSPSKQMMSPTPLAFTPTSVLRKMTAEKEPEGANYYQRHNIGTIVTPARKFNRFNRNRNRSNNNANNINHNNHDDNNMKNINNNDNANNDDDNHNDNNNDNNNNESREIAIEGKEKNRQMNISSHSDVLVQMNNNEGEQSSQIGVKSEYGGQKDRENDTGKDFLNDEKNLQVAILSGNNNNTGIVINSIANEGDNKNSITVSDTPEGNAEVSKLAAQSQANQMQQMQSAVQMIAQGLSRQQQQATVKPQVNQQPARSNQPVKPHPGRPIVKGVAPNQFPYGGPPNYQSQPPQSQLQQTPPVSSVQQQNQSQRPSPGIYGNPARSKHTMSTSLPPPNVPQYNVSPNSVISQRTNIMNNQSKQHLVQIHFANLLQHQQQRNVNAQVQLVLNQNYSSNRTDGRIMRPHHQQQQPMNIPMGRQSSPGSNGGSLSPTSNQLARWFSPELLAKARAGKLPELGQTNVLSLEELERLQQASAAVHH